VVYLQSLRRWPAYGSSNAEQNGKAGNIQNAKDATSLIQLSSFASTNNHTAGACPGFYIIFAWIHRQVKIYFNFVKPGQ